MNVIQADMKFGGMLPGFENAFSSVVVGLAAEVDAPEFCAVTTAVTGWDEAAIWGCEVVC